MTTSIYPQILEFALGTNKDKEQILLDQVLGFLQT